jgi:hypothetical protein
MTLEVMRTKNVNRKYFLNIEFNYKKKPNRIIAYLTRLPLSEGPIE